MKIIFIKDKKVIKNPFQNRGLSKDIQVGKKRERKCVFTFDQHFCISIQGSYTKTSFARWCYASKSPFCCSGPGHMTSKILIKTRLFDGFYRIDDCFFYILVKNCVDFGNHLNKGADYEVSKKEN